MRLRRVAIATVTLFLALGTPGLARAMGGFGHIDAAEGGTPVVDVVEVSGVIDTPIANYIAAEIAAANKRSSALLVISISSLGGLNVRTGNLVSLIQASRTPVAVYVGPQRAQAAGSAAMLVAASHIAAIGPSGRLGPAHPTNLAIDPDSARGKALHDATAKDLATLAGERGRDAPAFLDRSLPASIALAQHQVDYEVVGVAQLLERANGTQVTTVAGPVTLQLDKNKVVVRFHKPGPWPRLLHALINPSLVYILLITGVLLIVFEIFQPGFGVAGVTGGLMLTGAAYGVIVLPVALWALAAFVAGCVLLAVDVKLDGLGPPTFAGLGGFLAGSVWMFSAPSPALRMGWWLALVGTLSAFIFFVPVMTIVRRARQPVQRVADPGLVGEPGQVRSMLNPEGYVWVADALWRARAEEEDRIRVGEDVTVTGVDGSRLLVRRS